MDKANIIISIIIVLCIAAAVAAYGITNSDNPIFSDLSSMSGNGNNGNGLGNNTTKNVTNASVASTSGSGSSDSGSGSGSYDSGYSSGSSSSGSSSSSSGSGSGSRSGSSSYVSASEIRSDAWSHISEEGCYPGTPYQSGSYWYVTIYDANGTAVDGLTYSSSGAYLGRG